MAHAELSPSASKRWGGAGGCRASITQSRGKPNRSSHASRLGTAKHMVSALCLDDGTVPGIYLGRAVAFYSQIDTPDKEVEGFADSIDLNTVLVNEVIDIDQEFIDQCTAYVSYVREQVSLTGGELHVEVKLDIAGITGEVDATGTADAVIVCSDEVAVIDAKFGVGRVSAYEVSYDADKNATYSANTQLAMYGAAALDQFGWISPAINRVRMVIVQPPLNAVSEFTLDVTDLRVVMAALATAANETRLPDPVFTPSSDNCFFCAGRIDCAAREGMILSTVLEPFDNLDGAKPKVVTLQNLGDLYDMLPMLNRFAADVSERMLSALDNGQRVQRSDGTSFKLVTGKRGNRTWDDEAAVTALAQDMRIKDDILFSRKLITPAAMEKLTKARKPRNADASETDVDADTEKNLIGPVKWSRLQEHIVQADGKAEVALETDPRPVRHTVELEIQQTVVAAPTEIDLFA